MLNLVSTYTNKLALGATHTQNSADNWNDATAVASAKTVLTNTAPMQTQHIMGFGVNNPWPTSTGPKDWTSLDQRINLIRSTGKTPVITLCGAPTWMVAGGVDGTTDWSKLEIPPTEAHFDDFAALCLAVAQRYTDVLYFNVWNELKGFFNYPLTGPPGPVTPSNRWGYEAYTVMYNKIYAALKGFNPNIKLGGPYVTLQSTIGGAPSNPSSILTGPWGVMDQRDMDVVTYFLSHATGIDFLSVDGWTQPVNTGATLNDLKIGAQKFSDSTNWLKSLSSLPIWWTEFYSYAGWVQFIAGAPKPTITSDKNFTLGSTFILVALSVAGASEAFHWDAQAAAAYTDQGIFTPTTSSTGGIGTEFSKVFSWFKNQLPAGTTAKYYEDTTNKIYALAGLQSALILNYDSVSHVVDVPGFQSATVPSYGVYAPSGSTVATPTPDAVCVKVFINGTEYPITVC